MTDARPCWVYRFYGRGDVLLYVGITVRLPQRLREHGKLERWAEVARVATELHPDEPTAAQVEAAAIRAERPHWNIRGQYRAEKPQAPRVSPCECDTSPASDDEQTVVDRYVALAEAGPSALAALSDDELFAAFRDAEATRVIMREWTGRFVGVLRSRSMAWSQIADATGIPPTTLFNRAQRRPAADTRTALVAAAACRTARSSAA